MLESSSPSALLGNLPMLHDLGDRSPRDLVDEWQTFLGALNGLDKAIKDAGVEPGDFEDGKPPAGLSVAEQKAIADAAGQMSHRRCRAGRLRHRAAGTRRLQAQPRPLTAPAPLDRVE